MVQDVPYRHVSFPREYQLHHLQILSDRAHPEYNSPGHKEAHAHPYLGFETDKPNRNSIPATVPHRFLRKAGRTHKIPNHNFGNNRERTDAGKYIANDFHSADGSLPYLPTFSSRSVMRYQYLLQYIRRENGIHPALYLPVPAPNLYEARFHVLARYLPGKGKYVPNPPFAVKQGKYEE